MEHVPFFVCALTGPCYNLDPGAAARDGASKLHFSKPSFGGLKKEKKQGAPKKGGQNKREKGFPLANLDLAEMQLGGKLQRISRGRFVPQPHACAQHFRFQILRRTRSFPGRTSVRTLPGAIESAWGIASKDKNIQY